MTRGSGCYLFIFKHRNSRSCIKILSSSQNDVLTSAQGSSETRTLAHSCPAILGNVHMDRLAQSTYFRNPPRLPPGLLSHEAGNKTPQQLRPLLPNAHPSLSRAFPRRCAISLLRVPQRSLMHLWKEISFSLPSHFNILMSRSCCSAFGVLFRFVLYGNFILNKHYMAVEGMRWLGGSVMGCEAFPF